MKYKATYKHLKHDAELILMYPVDVDREDFDIWEDEWKLVRLVEVSPPVVPEPEVETKVV